MRRMVKWALAAVLAAAVSGCGNTGAPAAEEAQGTSSEKGAAVASGGLVTSCRLIEENYIEIRWAYSMENSDKTDNYQVKVNGKEAALDELASCYYDLARDNLTSLKLKDAVEDPETAQLEITMIADGVDDIRTAGGKTPDGATYKFGYDPFYKQTVTSQLGFEIRGSERVDPKALQMVAETVDVMLSKRPDVAEKMVENGAVIRVTAREEVAYCLPEFRDRTDPTLVPPTGGGGNKEFPYTYVAQDDVLENSYTKYPRENVLVHEFGHAIHLLGVGDFPDMIHAYEQAFINERQLGLYPTASYLNSNQAEFFACVSNIWFETVNEREDSTGFINTKEELKAYDPMTYEFFANLYPDERLPESCWDYESKFSNDIPLDQVPEAVPMEEPEDPYASDFPQEEYDLDTDYFKILSYLGTHTVTYEGNVKSWWDFSNTWTNVNFDSLSWKVTKVGDAYRFTVKKTKAVTEDLALAAENGGTEAGTVITVAPVREDDDSQLWVLSQTKGYFCQLVNKKSGLVLGTKGEILPSDGTALVLNPVSEEPSYANQWKVIRLKEKPEDKTLTEDKYCIRPEKK